MRLTKFILPGFIFILLLSAAGFVVWASLPSRPMPEAITALATDNRVIVENQEWLVFRPVSVEPVSGLIFYPGGRVDARAYAPLARAIAEAGYQVVIVPMPLNLAIFGAGRGQGVIEAYPDIQNWTIAGHSLGGAMAARFAYQNPGSVQGLVLMASYPASSDDLSDYDLEVLSIYGTQDMVMQDGSIESSRALLPGRTQWIAIQGGNHAQFGWYGSQAGDGQATITRNEQGEAVVQATLQLLTDLEVGRESTDSLWPGRSNLAAVSSEGQ